MKLRIVLWMWIPVISIAVSACRNLVLRNPPIESAQSEAVVDISRLYGDWDLMRTNSNEGPLHLTVSPGTERMLINVLAVSASMTDTLSDVQVTVVGGSLIASVRNPEAVDELWTVVRLSPQDDGETIVINFPDSDSFADSISNNALEGGVHGRGTTEEFIDVSASSAELWEYLALNPGVFANGQTLDFHRTPGTARSSHLGGTRDLIAISVSAILLVGVLRVLYDRRKRQSMT